MVMAHYAHLHNHTPHISRGMSPEEFCTKSKSSHIALNNANPCWCPTYVLEPRLQHGEKLPKWMPRSRRAQYWVSSHPHASTVVLVKNLQNVNIIPQLNMVFDDYFETLHSSEYQEPPVWLELTTFQSFKISYDDEYYVPNLADDLLEPVALESRRHKKLQRHPNIPVQE